MQYISIPEATDKWSSVWTPGLQPDKGEFLFFFVMEWQLRTVHWNSEQVCVCPAPSLLSTTPTFQTIPTNNKKRASNVKENAKYFKKKKNVTDLSNWSIPYLILAISSINSVDLTTTNKRTPVLTADPCLSGLSFYRQGALRSFIHPFIGHPTDL